MNHCRAAPYPQTALESSSPSEPAGTSHIVLSPSAARGREDHTYAVAWDAEVIQLFSASRMISLPLLSRRAYWRPEMTSRSRLAERERA